jgi:hypothetical protein
MSIGDSLKNRLNISALQEIDKKSQRESRKL